jgi:hypothetical protein
MGETPCVYILTSDVRFASSRRRATMAKGKEEEEEANKIILFSVFFLAAFLSVFFQADLCVFV